jgi:hypothetical protein
MEYHYHEEDPDDRKPACYLLTYRGHKYWSCYGIHLREWFEKVFEVERED